MQKINKCLCGANHCLEQPTIQQFKAKYESRISYLVVCPRCKKEGSRSHYENLSISLWNDQNPEIKACSCGKMPTIRHTHCCYEYRAHYYESLHCNGCGKEGPLGWDPPEACELWNQMREGEEAARQAFNLIWGAPVFDFWRKVSKDLKPGHYYMGMDPASGPDFTTSEWIFKSMVHDEIHIERKEEPPADPPLPLGTRVEDLETDLAEEINNNCDRDERLEATRKELAQVAAKNSHEIEGLKGANRSLADALAEAHKRIVELEGKWEVIQDRFSKMHKRITDLEIPGRPLQDETQKRDLSPGVVAIASRLQDHVDKGNLSMPEFSEVEVMAHGVDKGSQWINIRGYSK